MNRSILSMATVAMLFAACQTDDIVDDTLGGATTVERQIVISGTSAEVTRGYVSDDENLFAYVWDNTQQFALAIEDTTFDTEDGTADYSPMTITPAANGASATLATTLSLTYATVEAEKSIVSVGPLADNFADGVLTATMPTTFATGSAIPTDYLYIQGTTTTGAEELSYEELSLAINHTLVPAVVKFELSSSEITKVVMTASSAIFPTVAALDGTTVATSSNETTIIVENDAAAEALYALLLPTSLDEATIEVTAFIGEDEYSIGTISNITSFESSEAYVIPVTVTVEEEDDEEDTDVPVYVAPEVGDYYYADLTWSNPSELDTHKAANETTVIGVIYYLDESTGMALVASINAPLLASSSAGYAWGKAETDDTPEYRYASGSTLLGTSQSKTGVENMQIVKSAEATINLDAEITEYNTFDGYPAFQAIHTLNTKNFGAEVDYAACGDENVWYMPLLADAQKFYVWLYNNSDDPANSTYTVTNLNSLFNNGGRENSDYCTFYTLSTDKRSWTTAESYSSSIAKSTYVGTKTSSPYYSSTGIAKSNTNIMMGTLPVLTFKYMDVE